MNYILKHSLSDKSIFDFPVSELECKHVILDKPQDVYEASVNAKYEYVILGSHRHASINEENKRIFEMRNNIGFNRPVRVVKAKDGRMWCDNTHSAIAYISRNYKEKIYLKDIPFYLVDVSLNTPVIYSINGSVIENDQDINNVLECALSINARVDKGVRPSGMTYSIGDLYSTLAFYSCLTFKKWYADILNRPSCLLSELT